MATKSGREAVGDQDPTSRKTVSAVDDFVQEDIAHLKKQLAFEGLIVEFSAQLLRLPISGFEESLDPWLQRFAHALEVDRVSFMAFNEGRVHDNFARHYIVPGIIPLASDFVPRSIPFLDKVLKRNEVINWSRIPDDLPDDLPLDEVPFLNTGVKSFLAIPLTAGGVVSGFGTFGTYLREMHWSENLIQRLRFLGEIIAYTLMRKRDHNALLEEMEQRRRVEECNTAVLKSAGFGFWIIDLQDNIKEVNDAYCRMVGYTRDEILSMRVSDLDINHSQEDVQRTRETISKRGEFVFESSHRCKDGTIVDLEVSSAIMPLENEIFTFFRNITQKKAQDRLFHERFRFETLITNFSTALSKVSAGSLAQELVHWLKPFTEFLGVERCVVVEYDIENQTPVVLQSYSAPGLTLRATAGATLPVFKIRDILSKKGLIIWERIPEDLPTDADLSGMLMLKDGAKSCLALALASDDDVIGAMVFVTGKTYRRWSDDIIRRLKLVAQILSGALAKERAYQAMERRYQFERLVSEFSAAILERVPADLDEVISHWLERIAAFQKVDRVSVIELSDNMRTVNLTYNYTQPGIKLTRPTGELAINKVLISPIIHGEVTRYNRIPDDLPDDIDPAELKFVQDGTKSFLSVPLKARGIILGALSIGTFQQELTWQDDDVVQIKLIGEIIAGAIIRKRSHLALITEMKRRRMVEERNTTILSNTVLGLLISDMSGRIVEANNAFCLMVGYSRDELLTMHIRDLDDQYDEPSNVLHFKRQMVDKGSAVFETRYRCKDGSYLDLEISNTQLPDDNQLISFFRDVTAIKQAQREVEERLAFETLLSEFSAAMIRLPIGGFVTALKPWLERLTRYIDVDRCVVSRYNQDVSCVRALQAYATPGLPEILIDNQYIPSFGLQKYLKRGQIIKLENVGEELPDDQQLRESPMVKEGTKSLISLPLEFGDAIIGIVSFGSIRKYKKWSEEIIRRLKLVAQVISNALMREEAAETLEKRLRYEELLSGCSTALINLSVSDFERPLTDWLKKFVEITGVDHVSVAQLDEDANTFTSLSTYSVSEIDPPPAEHKYKPPRSVVKRLFDGENIYFDRIPENHPRPGTDRNKKPSIETRKTLLVIPLMTQGDLIGTMAFSCYRFFLEFTEEQVRVLRLLGEIVANFLSRRRSELELKGRLDFEALISGFSAALINVETDNLHIALGNWIQRLVEFLDVDRGVLVQYNDDLTQCRLIQSYSAPFLPSLAIDGHSRPVKGFLSRVRAGEAIVWERIPEEIPDNLGFDEPGIGTFKTKSVLMLPMAVGGVVIGALLFSAFRETKKWSSVLVARFKLVGEIIANALLRSRAEIQLSAYKDHLEDLVEARTAELKAVQKDLVQSERLATLGKLTATVSHELRNPLGTIRSSLYSINQRIDDQAGPIRRAVDRAERGIVRCDRIVEELLGYTRTPSLEVVPTQIDSWLKGILDEDGLPTGIQEIRDFNADIKVDIDRERLQRCIANVVANGVHAIEQAGKTRGEGRMVIATSIDAGYVEITIEDNGVGIPSENIEKIFEPLFSTKNFGVGLGVPIAKQVVEQHGGTMTFQSEPGVFTKVIIKLPIKS